MTFRPIHLHGSLYFVTGTIVNWEPIFLDNSLATVILESLTWHRANKRMKLFAFVLMSSHIHWISLPIEPFTINNNIQSFTSYTAHEILSKTRSNNNTRLMELFKEEAKTGKHHRIWWNFQAKYILNYRFLQQKLEYIHNNPTKKSWFESDTRSDYLYSSASFYDVGRETIIQVDDIFEYLDDM